MFGVGSRPVIGERVVPVGKRIHGDLHAFADGPLDRKAAVVYRGLKPFNDNTSAVANRL